MPPLGPQESTSKPWISYGFGGGVLQTPPNGDREPSEREAVCAVSFKEGSLVAESCTVVRSCCFRFVKQEASKFLAFKDHLKEGLAGFCSVTSVKQLYI